MNFTYHLNIYYTAANDHNDEKEDLTLDGLFKKLHDEKNEVKDVLGEKDEDKEEVEEEEEDTNDTNEQDENELEDAEEIDSKKALGKILSGNVF